MAQINVDRKSLLFDRWNVYFKWHKTGLGSKCPPFNFVTEQIGFLQMTYQARQGPLMCWWHAFPYGHTSGFNKQFNLLANLCQEKLENINYKTKRTNFGRHTLMSKWIILNLFAQLFALWSCLGSQFVIYLVNPWYAVGLKIKCLQVSYWGSSVVETPLVFLTLKPPTTGCLLHASLYRVPAPPSLCADTELLCETCPWSVWECSFGSLLYRGEVTIKIKISDKSFHFHKKTASLSSPHWIFFQSEM